MGDFRSEQEKQEEQELHQVRDLMAAYRALPLRVITAIEGEGRIARLDCGHWKVLLACLLPGDSMRCRECFEDHMRSVERMVERSWE